MSGRTILVVEDDAPIRQGICDALAFAGYKTVQSATFQQGLREALLSDHDLLLLDLVLPGGDGLQNLRELRAARPTAPVIILTARGEEKDRVRGLRMGADDYVVKPFSVHELLARVEAVLRRSPERPTDVQSVALKGGVADLVLSEVRFDDGERCELSAKEAELLRYLACNAGRTISRKELLSRVWGVSPLRAYTTRTVDIHVARLRGKLRDDPSAPHTLRTVRGKGYAFCPPADQGPP